ncbi:prepilin peptidase [Xinfangfangia sp. CPCC 101601]|uniref:Prepilin peptidase n=1 Tax=Pseudogemmobacter lacusdianii TaxID=3069608 RepID=A0ABU0VT28_9RHOB|nr:prepilin peptidase [Xinfangfangia sp. CPCC 101601]MDQ2064882.1 prepilin peptidase [Xinfangfangia sp. CPCC 101601]
MDLTNPPLREALIFLPFVLPIAIWVAWSDMARMKIPNKAVIAMAALWPLLGWLVFPWQLWLLGIGIMVIVLVVGFIGNIAGLFGAGDAKFAAAMAGIFTAGDPMFIAALYAICSIGAFVVHRGLRAIPAVTRMTPEWKSWTHKKFPMGLALSAMVVIYLLAAFLPKG